MNTRRKSNNMLVWLLLSIFVVALLWAMIFQIDQTVNTQGQVITATRTQIIQAADGGVISKLLVKEGQRVKAGQLLARLEKQRAEANFQEINVKLASMQAAIDRARAEAEGGTPAYRPSLKSNPQFIAEQTALFYQKRKLMDDELKSTHQALALAADELDITEKLLKTGDISRVEFLRAKRQVVDLQSKAEGITNKYRQDARLEIAKLQEEFTSLGYKADERLSVQEHTDLRSPVDGVVKQLRVNTLGGVLRPGDELMHISPTGVDLQLEVKIKPSDVGLVHVGMPVSIKIDAFDYTIYGSINGKLDYVSSDTLTDNGPNGAQQSFYRATVTFSPDQVNNKLNVKSLKAGMTATADIRLGARSVLVFILKPVFKAFSGAGSQK